MGFFRDGPASPRCRPLEGVGQAQAVLPDSFSPAMRAAWSGAPQGEGVSRGVPFRFAALPIETGTRETVAVGDSPAPWLIVAFVVDVAEQPRNECGVVPGYRGGVLFGQLAARIVLNAGGRQASVPIRRGREVGHWRYSDTFTTRPTEAHAHVSFRRESALPPDLVEMRAFSFARMGGLQWDPDNQSTPWVTWLFALPNPWPGAPLDNIEIEADEPLLLQGITLAECSENPLRWRERRKTTVAVPAGSLASLARLSEVDPMQPVPADAWQELRSWEALAIDLGEIASIAPVLEYDDAHWDDLSGPARPRIRPDRLLIEYSAHADARLYWPDGTSVDLRSIEDGSSPRCEPVAPAHRRVRVRVVDASNGLPVAARLHVHGAAGEYLAPEARHRKPTRALLVDDGIDFIQQFHLATYVDGHAVLRLPEGAVHFEVSKGFETSTVRRTVHVGPGTEEILLPLERRLDWRERGWVTADTHVHALSPSAALLQTAAEGVNVTHLLASQWGEYVSNAGDFDGRSTLRVDERDEAFLVRVGTENRQFHLGHLSLLGYSDRMILPLCSGGPDESALGDPVEVLVTEWAEQCRRQGGIVVLPHFEGPRCESAAAIVAGQVDAVEMCSFRNAGLDPYALSAWYRYLNCGYALPAVGGTDKMMPTMPIGLVRTYARLREGESLTLASWSDAIRRGETFVTFGPLIEFAVAGRPPGSSITLGRQGGRLDVTWSVETLGAPISRVELVRNGEVVESSRPAASSARGSWQVPVTSSGWLAMLVRTQQPDGPEMISAHSSTVSVRVEGSACLPAADALSILNQIEGAIGFLDTIATRPDADRHRRMRMRLTALHRQLHDRMHAAGLDHLHGVPLAQR